MKDKTDIIRVKEGMATDAVKLMLNQLQLGKHLYSGKQVRYMPMDKETYNKMIGETSSERGQQGRLVYDINYNNRTWVDISTFEDEYDGCY